MNDDQKVSVTYPDGKGNHETTVGELREKWASHGETKKWIADFFIDLKYKGKAFSAFGEYNLIPNQ